MQIKSYGCSLIILYIQIRPSICISHGSKQRSYYRYQREKLTLLSSDNVGSNYKIPPWHSPIQLHAIANISFYTICQWKSAVTVVPCLLCIKHTWRRALINHVWLYGPMTCMDLLYTVNSNTKTNCKKRYFEVKFCFTGVQGCVLFLSSANGATAWMERDTKWEKNRGRVAHERERPIGCVTFIGSQWGHQALISAGRRCPFVLITPS